jgi:hypothetical protein
VETTDIEILKVSRLFQEIHQEKAGNERLITANH